MPGSSQQSGLAWLLADRSRYLMLTTLMDGRAKTAKELAYAARITAPTASSHLGKLVRASIIGIRRQGRHSYYRIERDDVVRVIEGMMVVDGSGEIPTSTHRGAPTPLQHARFCYDHLAGSLGVELLNRMVSQGFLVAEAGHYRATTHGETFFTDLGVDVEAMRASRRVFACACLDWSERREHLGGALGSGVAQRMLAKKWLKRHPDSRVVTVTASGVAALRDLLGLNWRAANTRATGAPV